MNRRNATNPASAEQAPPRPNGESGGPFVRQHTGPLTRSIAGTGYRHGPLVSRAPPPTACVSTAAVFGPHSAIPREMLANYPPQPQRPQAIPRHFSSSSAIARHRDPSSETYDPAYADALEAAVQSSIPLHGQFEQTAIQQRSTRLVVEGQSRQPPTHPQPPMSSVRKLTAISQASSPLQNAQGPSISRDLKRKFDIDDNNAASAPSTPSAVVKSNSLAPASSAPAAVVKASFVSQPKSKTETDGDYKKRRARERQQQARQKAKEESVPSGDPTPASKKQKTIPAEPKAPPAPQFHLDRGPGNPNGPSAWDILVEWMAGEGNLLRFRSVSTAEKLVMMREVHERLISMGMADRPLHSLVAKVKDLYKRVCEVADQMRNQTGFGVGGDDDKEEEEEEDEEAQLGTIQEMLESTTDGQLYLQLEEVLCNRHSVNPLHIHDSAKVGKVGKVKERQSLIDTLLRSAGPAIFTDDELTENDNEANPASVVVPEGGRKKGRTLQRTARLPVPDDDEDEAPPRRMGPANRTANNMPSSSNPAQGAGGNNSKNKGKDDADKVVADRLESHAAILQARSDRNNERLLARQAYADARLTLETERAEREKIVHDREHRQREHLHQLGLAERFAAMVNKRSGTGSRLDPDSIGRVVFGEDAWKELKPVMMALVEIDGE
ncbi:hypothetical protein QFC24_001297 [Naganishia onofrii]|uniref:Uncharacterized protein n=1 Tax=Naganishia onofrii TaxID=1851511 RepID=A0ACC2XUM2_9TREE|nr:hypothetical protein QFC24_001297 [Naganishia onofrii]